MSGWMRAMPSMYEMPERADAIATWWEGLLRHWHKAGLTERPKRMPVATDLCALWLAPDLFLAQTCGYPLTHRLRGKVRVVATPCYAVDGCDGPNYCSLILARRDDSIASVAEIANRTVAINGKDSQSGWHALRHSLIGHGAPAAIIETGAHRQSIAAVRECRADVAAVDCVTFAMLKAVAPREVAPLKVIARSASAPALPFITRASASDAEIDMLRAGLMSAAADPTLAPARNALFIEGFVILAENAYDRILELEQAADRAGVISGIR